MSTATVTPTPSGFERLRVLVVDDEYGPRESIAFTLGTEFEVDKAERAREALELIAKEEYAVIILDIRMPEMDGIKALEKIRDLDPEVAVVMLTGYGTLATAQQAMMGGANQYLRKPPDIEELMEAVRQQAKGTLVRRQEESANSQAKSMLEQLKQEMSEVEMDVWQGRASVELVHDLANPLTVLIGYAGLLKQEAESLAKHDPKKAERLMEFTDIVARSAGYCHHLAENWRQVSKGKENFVELDLVDLAKEIHRVMFYSKPTITLGGLDELMVRGSRMELARVFQNLMRNALDAEPKRVEVIFEKSEDEAVVRIRDNGEGMDETTIHRAMKGGFTTKEHGTGLGLSICRHLLGAHGANLAVESVKNEGTEVRLSFPAQS